MSLFDKLKRKTTEQQPVETGWENMDVVADKKEYTRKRQHDKLIQMLKVDGNPNMSVIGNDPEPAGPHDEDIVLAKIAAGKTKHEDFALILDNIMSPLHDHTGAFDQTSINNALSRISESDCQLNMLNFAIDKNVDTSTQMDGNDLVTAEMTFKNPMQFEAKIKPFMEYLAANNPKKTVDKYQAALADLEHNLFGKKYEYYERMKELVGQSRNIFGFIKQNPLVEENVPVVRRAKLFDIAPKTVEEEKSYESLIRRSSFYQISKNQVSAGMRADYGEILGNDPTCEDSSVIDEEKGFFGVFDGAGGHSGARRASNIGVETMIDFMNKKGEPKTIGELASWLNEASHRISADPEAGFSTATVAKVIELPNGKKGVIYAQVGDSRLYIIDKSGHAELITKDEGFGRVITNSLGGEDDAVCKQTGYRELNPGDKLMICSDGITGDVDAELMSEQEVGNIVSGVDTAYAAQALAHNARKVDDRTAIVVEV